jgi:histidyl-tRNA synthetase
VLRAVDKLDRLGVQGVRALLGAGRKDESGDFTKGAELSPEQIARVLAFVAPEQGAGTQDDLLDSLAETVRGSAVGETGIAELREIVRILNVGDYGSDRVRVDSGIVRGLDYYTGAVYEAQLSFPATNEEGETVVFGSVGGGGRYDDLIARFTGQTVPASGISIGVSRLLSVLRARAGAEVWQTEPLIVVLVLDKGAIAESFKLAQELRAAGLRAEAYVGEAGMKAQLKYADRRGAAVAVIEGGDERARGEVTLKDLALGAELAKSTEDRAAWVKDRPAQQSVKRADMVAAIRAILGARGG